VTSPSPGSDAHPDRDTWLIGLVAAGDRHAFDVLYRAYFPRLTRFLGRMTRSTSLIEEIVNDAMLVAWQKAASFDRSCKLSTWVFAIAYRKACKALHALDEARPDDADGWPGDPDKQPERLFEQACLGIALETALETLPLAQRAAFQLTFYHDMGYADIAEVMECPVNTVKTRLFHARRRLATLLAAQMEEKA
jgi:RNA polymerase sigma-70 factor (ECF subfamily)